MIPKILAARLSFAVFALVLFGSRAIADVTPVTVVELTPAQGKLLDLLTQQIEAAHASNRTPFIEISATWCAPCKKLAAALGDPLMQDAFAGTHIIRLDLDAWGDELKPLGLDTRAVPAFLAVDNAAHATGPAIDGSAWAADIPRNMAPSLKSFVRKNGAKAS